MNLLDMDVGDKIEYIIDVYTKVFGEEYRDIITKRLKNTVFIMYNNLEGMKEYVIFLKECKRKELSVKFLEEIGIDVSKYHIKSYAEELDEELKKIINEYIGGYILIKIKGDFLIKGIKAWDSFYSKGDKRELQIKFINFIRGKGHAKITKKNYKNFQKTEEYKEILDKIQEWIKIYDQIVTEYEAYLQEISPYEKYIKDEEERKRSIHSARIFISYIRIKESLPEGIKTFLDSNFNNDKTRARVLMGDNLGTKTYVEYFSKKDEEKLQDTEVSEEEKAVLYFYRIEYFKKMGIKLKDENHEHKDIKELYESYISQDDAKQIIPPSEFASMITLIKEIEFENAKKDFICSSKDFMKTSPKINDAPGNREVLYSTKVKNLVCIITGEFKKGKNEPKLPLFFTIADFLKGEIDYAFLHEVCHAIEVTDSYQNDRVLRRTGFELSRDKNPYDDKKRKYEILNESIADILAMEALDYIHEDGRYIFEPENISYEYVTDKNMPSAIKKLLYEFVGKYRKHIIRARITGNMSELYDVIGEDNFEELNDCINKIAYLISLKEYERNNALAFHSEEQRLDKIYIDMEKHQSKDTNNDKLLKSAISLTEERTRTSQINRWIEKIKRIFSKKKTQDKEERE